MATSVAIIPARGGSKRIPRKNIRKFRGRPIIAWSVEAALESGAFDEVMVSTDDEEIASVARSCGANVPFMRSPRTADDTATTSDVLFEVLECYGKAGREFAFGCCIYPTAPFMRASDLAHGKQRLADDGFDVIMPIAAFSYPVWRSLRRDDDGRLEMNFPENLNARSQDLPPAFHDAGQWYWFRTAAFLSDRVLLGPNTGSVMLPSTQVQDIDTEEDWTIAEWKHERIFG
ncbi:pseudaminic acid cytidylyltransferase [Nitratireductor sp. XY-223]|uniref:pseudaminic acid cytidylyltransferase n=1 Tax=Nitratireductor sp. XY-223 TaxID=2561926 RepID=UPI0010AB04F8|nr:pseudaminic acid cytidylyltransferase [Nitratireductor sp. XY-223]